MMDSQTDPASLNRGPGGSTEESPDKQHLQQSSEQSNGSHRDQVKSRKRPFRDISTGFTKAVIICNSSELTKSEANSYRPNNIVIELLKKNAMRYGKATFHKFTSEKEVRDELSSRFPVLKNRTFKFASADQYGKLNFRELEEWSGRNLRRWLPGSSAMYIILETSSQADDESEAHLDSELAKDGTPYRSISCTTVRAGTSATTNPTSWRANNSQRALLDFLSSPENSKLCNTQKLKMLAISTGQKESKPPLSLSSKSPARLDLRSLALCTKNERINADLHPGISRKQDCFSARESLLSETEILAKRRRTFHSSRSAPSFTTLTRKTFSSDTNEELEHQNSKTEKRVKELPDVKMFSNIRYENSQDFEKEMESTKEQFIQSKTNILLPKASLNGSLESTEERKESKANVSRNHPDESRIPRYIRPSYRMPDPLAIFGNKPASEEQKEDENDTEIKNGNARLSASHAGVSPMQAFYVPSTGYFHWGQVGQGSAMYSPDKGPIYVPSSGLFNWSQGSALHSPDKRPSFAFVPFEFLPYPTSGRVFPYGFTGSTLTCTPRNEAHGHDLSLTNKMDQNIKETIVHETKSEKEVSEERPKDSLFPCSEVSIETHPVVPNNCSTSKDKNKDLFLKFLDISEKEERNKDQNSKQNCEMFPCSGPCKGGQSFVVVLSQPLEDKFNEASFCAIFDDVSVIKLTRVDHSTLKGKAIPESHESGHVTVRIEANGHPIGCASFAYDEGFIDGLKNVIFSEEHGERLLQFITSSEEERYEMQNDLIDWLELVVYMSVQKRCTSAIDKIIGSKYGEAVKAQCSRRTAQSLQLALSSRHAELSRYLKSKLSRNDLENEERTEIEEAADHVEAAAHEDFDQQSHSSSPSDSNGSAHAYECDESRDNDLKKKDPQLVTSAENLLLLSSIASRMETKAATGLVNKPARTSSPKGISNGTTSAATNTLTEETCSDEHRHTEETSCKRDGFLKKVFVLPPNSLYLPSQSELCKLRGTRSAYCKVYFNAEMSEDDVFEQIRRAFDDLVDTSFRLAVVDQTGKLVFYEGLWTGKVIRRKLRGNSVLYIVPVVEKEDQD